MNINNNVTNLQEYIEGLCRRHKSILHTDRAKHFFKGGIEDFFIGLRNKVRFPAIVFDGFELVYSGSGDDVDKEREFAFIVVQEYDRLNNVDQIEAAKSDCEKIGEDFFNKILEDIDNSTCMFDFSFATGIVMENVNERYTGIQFTCVLTSKYNTEVNNTVWEP